MLQQRTRKRLSEVVVTNPHRRQDVRELRRIERQFKLRDIPRCLDRSRWTKRDWARSAAAWAEIDRENKRKIQHRLLAEQMAAKKAKRRQQHKIIIQVRKELNQEKKDERAGRKVRKARTDYENHEKVLRAMRGGATTVGQVCKVTGLETRYARRTLRQLVAEGLVVKPSSRQYNLAAKRQRKRLSDVEPTRRRKRLNTSRKRSR